MNIPAIIGIANLINEEDEDENRRLRLINMRRNNNIRNMSDPIEYMSDQQFLKKFRFPKRIVEWICDQVTPHLHVDEANGIAIPIRTQIFCTLRFYATGCFQATLSDVNYISISQPTVSRILTNVSNAIINALEDDWINFPNDEAEFQRISENLEQEIGFPGVIGVVDCTHVAIRAPFEDKWNYLNHNRYYSINVQVTCDDRMRITSVDAYPGATHDSRIWNNSEVKEAVDEINNNRNINYFLIGDAGYPMQQCLLTPFPDAQDNTPEAAYNERFTHTRCLIERVFGILKGKWRCLHKYRTLHYQPQKALLFFRACAILYNIFMRHLELNPPEPRDDNSNADSTDDSEEEGEEEREGEGEAEAEENQQDVIDINEAALNAQARREREEGRLLRNEIIQQYFANNINE